MRAFLFYIDDWLSSLRIKQMDAHEEVAYLHLLLAAATAEDCGLPADEKQLSMLSGLGPQWFKPTKEKDKRIDGMTSGAKVLACFFPRGGRIYNDRLLKEWQHQKDVNESRRAAGKLGGRPRKANGYGEENQTVSVEKPNGIANDNHTAKQTKTNDVCVSASVSALDFQKFLESARDACFDITSELEASAKPAWDFLDFEGKLAAVAGIKARIAAGEYGPGQESFVPLMHNYLREKRWKRRIRKSAAPELPAEPYKAKNEWTQT